MRVTVGAVSLLAWVGCGGGGELTPQPLVADPAVETGCATARPGAGESRAKPIACVDELALGRLASGRIGDYLLENDRIQIVVRGFGEGYYLMGTKPGGIVDAARHGATDQIKEVLPVFGLKGGAFDELVITEAGDNGPAALVVRGRLEPVPFVESAVSTGNVHAIVEQHYVLEPDTDALLIRTFVFPDDTAASSEANVEVGEALFFGGVINSWAPGKGVPAGSSSVEFIASTGEGGTSYGVIYPVGKPAAAQFADIANVKLILGPSRTIGNAEPVDRWFVVGDGSAASVTERGWALRGLGLGTVRGMTAPGVDIAVASGDKAMTIGRADDTGAYRIALPAGDYHLTATSPARAAGIPLMVTVTEGGEVAANLVAGATGTLSLSVTDGVTPLPARVVIRDANGVLERRIEYAGADGALELGLPVGSYIVDVSRGMEYDAFTVDPLTIEEGQTQIVAATLTRVVDTAGWISLDTHIHSEMSTDSQVPLDVRLRSVAAEGVEVPISTDHDFVSDYSPVIAELGLQSWLTAQSGVETSSLVWGHVNSWPLVPDYDRGAGGAVPWYQRSPGQVYGLMRERGDHVVIQLNHPYHSSAGNLDTLDFNLESGLAERDPADLGLPDDTNLSDFDFDALEVSNDFNASEFGPSFASFLALVATGHPVVATGSSDSHGRSAYIGNSRTYVYVGPGNDDPGTIDLDAVNAALKARKVVVGQGAFVTAGIVAPGGAPAAPGELVDLEGETGATLRIKVQAPPWMPLARIVVYAGREVATTINLDSADTSVVRYDADVTNLPLGTADGFFLVLVEAAGPGTPVIGMPTGSYTNPLLYDADGDGLWMP